MARTKQTARLSTGGFAPRNMLTTVDIRDSMEVRTAKEALNTAIRDNYGIKAVAQCRYRLQELLNPKQEPEPEMELEMEPEQETETDTPEVARARVAYAEAVKHNTGKMAMVCKLQLDDAIRKAKGLPIPEPEPEPEPIPEPEERGTKRTREDVHAASPQAKRRATMQRKKKQCNDEAKLLLEVLHSHFRSDGTVCTAARSSANPFPLFSEFSGTALNRVAAVWTQMAVETRKMAKVAVAKEKTEKARVRQAKLEAVAKKANDAVAKIKMMFD